MSCSCGRLHSHEPCESRCGYSGRERGRFFRLLVSAVFFVTALFLPLTGWIRASAFAVPYLVAGAGVLRRAGENLLRGDLFDENFLMAASSIGAFGIGEYPEGAAVMILFGIGEYFEDLAVEKSRRSIEKLAEICPDEVDVFRHGEAIRCPPEKVQPGETVLVQPGDRIALDGIVLSGSAALDTAALTGESAPTEVSEGDFVRSGCISTNGVLHIRVTNAFSESTISRILALVEDAENGKSKSESFIHKFAKVYTPSVIGAAALLAVVPSLITGAWSEWIRRALTFLMISCPCALVISVPLSFFGGIGGASRRGILVKGSHFMEALAKAEIIAFDKTGTLTEGRFSVTDIRAENPAELLRLAAGCEQFSRHPVGAAITAAYREKGTLPEAVDGKEEPGYGLSARMEGKTVFVGNARLMQKCGAGKLPDTENLPGTVVHVAEDGRYLGYILLEDKLKASAVQAVQELKALGVKKCVMLSGDRKAAVEKTAEAAGFDAAYAQLSPEGKLAAAQDLKLQLSEKGTFLYAGDGINDAPVLAAAHAGIAMGALGTDAAVEAADVVLMHDDPLAISLAIRIARKTIRVARENIFFALAVKAAVLSLGALGHAPLWAAVLVDVGVCLLCIGNSLRTLRI